MVKPRAGQQVAPGTSGPSSHLLQPPLPQTPCTGTYRRPSALRGNSPVFKEGVKDGWREQGPWPAGVDPGGGTQAMSHAPGGCTAASLAPPPCADWTSLRGSCPLLTRLSLRSHKGVHPSPTR